MLFLGRRSAELLRTAREAAARLIADRVNRTAMAMFGFSILYLFVLFAAMMAPAEGVPGK